jgi:hypothetical protein
MHLRLFQCLLLAAVAAGAGCGDSGGVPRVVREGVKNVPCAPDTVITYLQKPVTKGCMVYFHGDEKPVVVPGDGYLVWFDENNGVRWPHMAKLAWIPSDPEKAQRVLKRGRLCPAFRVVMPNDRPMGRMVWNEI